MAIVDEIRSPLRSLDGAPVWLNSDPLGPSELHGRVVLVQFWTYSCINWLRTLPYVRAWHRRYRDRGLTVIGAHAPEFGFEHDLENVRRANCELEVEHPVVIDNGFDIWRAFENRYWPALYLLDGEGRVRFHHFGEGFYSETEQAIQQLLGAHEDLTDVEVPSLSAAADLTDLRSPETYLGTARGERRGAGSALNSWDLTGRWTVGAESAVLDAAVGAIVCRFQARDVNLVLEAGSIPAPFSVLLDGREPGADRGLDTDESGAGTVATPRMYQLIRRLDPGAPGRFEVEFAEPGVRAYVFTFG